MAIATASALSGPSNRKDWPATVELSFQSSNAINVAQARKVWPYQVARAVGIYREPK